MKISETLSHYLEGGTRNDFSTLKKAFYPAATMRHIGDETFKSVNALEFFGNAMKPGPPSNRKTKIVTIDVAGTAAQAKLQIDFPDFRLTDFMQLLKIDGEWKIVSKIFAGESAEEITATNKLNSAEKAVLNVMHRWKMAMIYPNPAEVDKILAADWTYAGGMDGNLGAKPIYDPNEQVSETGLVGLDLTGLQLRQIAKDVMLVSGKEVMRGIEDGKETKGYLRFSDVFKQNNGKWQAVLTHSSPRVEE
ncbi:MAG: nuclear transport factor 2 family protein [Saprospiraceae bacterium]